MSSFTSIVTTNSAEEYKQIKTDSYLHTLAQPSHVINTSIKFVSHRCYKHGFIAGLTTLRVGSELEIGVF